MTYILRDVDDGLWLKVKVRAAQEGKSIREVLIGLLRAYIARRAPKKGDKS